VSDSREIFSYPEMSLYLYTGSTSGIFAYAENVELSVARTIARFVFPDPALSYSQRTLYIENDRQVTLTLGALYAGQSVYAMLQSGANISATINFNTVADGKSANFVLWSAQVRDFKLGGAEGAVWHQNLTLISPGISGL
jgi:hypothetical protein